MPSELFRPSALRKLSSPEQLDQLFTYADPKAWIALAALIGLLLLALLWGIFGSVPTRIEGRGILLGEGGVVEVTAPGSGILTEAEPLQSGDAVRQGQLLARIAQPLLEREIEFAEARLKALPADGFNPGTDSTAEQKERLALLRARAELAGRVVAPAAGRLVELKASPGERVAEGQPLFGLERGDRGLAAMVYLPPESEIRQVRPGALVQLSPATTRREEAGFLLGRVAAVTPFPASRQGMMALLGNESLVERLAGGGAPFAVRVELLRDAAGGYRWSAGAGGADQADEVGSGTLCSAAVVLREEPPLLLLLPWLKRLLGSA